MKKVDIVIGFVIIGMIGVSFYIFTKTKQLEKHLEHFKNKQHLLNKGVIQMLSEIKNIQPCDFGDCSFCKQESQSITDFDYVSEPEDETCSHVFECGKNKGKRCCNRAVKNGKCKLHCADADCAGADADCAGADAGADAGDDAGADADCAFECVNPAPPIQGLEVEA